MKLYFKNKWFSFKGESFVKDEKDNDVYQIKGKVFSISNKKFVQDMAGNTFYVVRNKVWSFAGQTAYIMDREENIISTVKRKFFSIKDKYTIDSPFGPMTLNGNIFGFDYHIAINGNEIGRVHRLFSMRDEFYLDVDDQYDIRFFVALITALDNLTDARENNGSSITVGRNG